MRVTYATSETDEGESRSNPEQYSEVLCCTSLGLGHSCFICERFGACGSSEFVEALRVNDDCQQGIGENPKSNQSSSERLVRIVKGLLVNLDFGLERSKCSLDSNFKRRVDICLWLINFLYDLGFTVIRDFGNRRRQNINLIRTLGTPGYIVPIAEGIDVKDIDIRRDCEKVLGKTVQHVPWVQIDNRGNEVKTKCGSQGNDNQLCYSQNSAVSRDI